MFLETLPIEKFWGVGPKTAVIMHKMGIFNGKQLRQCTLNHLTEVFGKSGKCIITLHAALMKELWSR